ncbi:MAG: hypothetical protein F9K18_10025 [Thermoanaerobaculia bacterium]|nr:MAG: hypothetical protein F9K18_10025 [Thermoanaerobaculia bacterium]
MTVYDKARFTVLACQLLFALIALPLALRRVRPNVVYGFRTRATLADEGLWYAVNARFGWAQLAGSLAGAAAALVLFRPGLLPLGLVIPVSLVVLIAPAAVAGLAAAARLRGRRGE